MKRYSRLFIAALAAFGLASCSQELDQQIQTPQGNLVTVNFGAEAAIEGATKATLTPNEDDTFFKSAWENGDALGVQYYNDGMEGNEQVVHATWNETSYSFSTALPEFTGRWIYRAAYPAPEADGSVEFGSSRTQKGNAYNSKYDLMRGSVMTEAPAGKTDEGKDIIFDMTRETAIAYFHFTSSLNEEVVSAKLSVAGGSIANSSVTTDYHNSFVFSGDKSLNEITITFEDGTAPKASDFKLWYNIRPTSYGSMTLEVETTAHKMTINRNSGGVYEAGRLYKVVKDIADDKWIAKGGETPKPTVIEDVLTADKFKAKGTTYTAFTGVKATSPAVYAGNTANNNGAIQMRSKNSDCGIVTTTSGGSATRVSVVWGVTSAKDCTIDIYGKSTAYSKASDLYATQDGDQGTKIGSIICGTSTELVIEGDYPYIGIRSKSGALYLDSITITWGDAKTTLKTPANLQVSAEKVVSWDAVSGAASYEVTIGENTFASETTSYDAAAIADDYYDVAVVAVPSDKENYKNSAAATLTGVKFGTPTLATPTLKEGVIDGASISVSWSVDKHATAGYNCELFKGGVKVGESKTVNAGAVTFTGLDAETAYVVKVNAIAVEGAKAYAASSVATLDVTTKAASATANDGSLERPYTAAEAIAAIDANTDLTGKYVKGIVKATPSFNATYSSLTYDIESGKKTLNIYSGKDLGKAGFVGAEDLKAGDEVVVYGDLKLFKNNNKTTYELDKNNYLISINGETQIYRGLAVSEPNTAFNVGDTFELGGKVLQVWRGKEDVDVTTSATFSGYDMSTEGKQIVTVTVGDESVTYEITVNPAGTVLEKSETISLKNGNFSNNTITWSGTSCSFVQEKGTSNNKPNESYISAPRWYQNNVITFKANAGYKITKVVVNCVNGNSDNYKYVNALKNSTYSPEKTTSATVAQSSTEVTITTAGDFTITMSAQSRISSVVVYYTK